MASLLTIKLNKAPGMSWGIRLQGGKDFAAPLCIQKVNPSSVAEKSGLQPGDAIVSINGHDVFSLRHKEAQDLIVKAGNNFDMVVQRGMQTWRPTVTALPEVQRTPEGAPVATKTSLAATPQRPLRCIGSNYNCVPRPFPGSSSFNNGSVSSPTKTVVQPQTITVSCNGRPTTPDSRGDGLISPVRSAFSNGYHSPSSPPVNGTSGPPVNGTSGPSINGTSSPRNTVSRSNSSSKTFGFWPQKFDIDEATSALKITGTDIALNKENARNFLLMTLDNDIKFNEHKQANHVNKDSSFLRSTNSLPRINSLPLSPGGAFAKHKGPRKYSYGSNCSSLSSASSQDGDSEELNHRQFLDIPPPKIVNAQFNSPINIYSEDAIAETLSAQAEVLSKGVLGVNFMKNDKAYDGKTSDVLRMVQEMDCDPRCESPGIVMGSPSIVLGSPFAGDRPVAQGHSFKLLEKCLNEPAPHPTQSFSPAGQVPHADTPGSDGLQPGDNICAGCERLITGVFVRVKNKNLHADCFKCATCGSSLKNVGYYNINEKLYCDIHAKQAVRHNPPAPNMVPLTVQPGVTPPAGAMTSPQARAMKAPFQSKAPLAGPSPAPISAPFKPPAGGIKLPSAASFTLCSPAPYKRVPVAPAPSFVPAPAPFKVAPPAHAPVVAPSFHQSSANPQNFGAPAGDFNVRAHIPKKDAAPGPAPAPVAPAPAQASSFGSNFMPKPTPPPGGISFPKLGGAARGFQAPGQRSAPRRGRGVMNPASASRIPVCAACQRQIRGPFVSALGKTWCPDHFICATETCRKPIIEMGFVEEQGKLYCEVCYESYLAPICGKCDKRVKGDCLNAVGKQFHPECFCCAYCGKVFGSGAFYLEDGLPYCETDWNDLFTTKCVGCNFPIEAGDRWVEALNNNYHSQCFKCSKCHKNLEGQSFFAKGGKPFCKAHAQRGF